MMEIDRKTTGIHKITQLNSRVHGSAQLRGARRRVTMCTRAFGRPSERWPSGRRHQIANLAYWVTGTEGSNPSLSAIESQISGILWGNAQTARIQRQCAPPVGTGERSNVETAASVFNFLSA